MKNPRKDAVAPKRARCLLNRRIVVCVLLSAFSACCPGYDTITMSGGKTCEGFLTGYSNLRFFFMKPDNRTFNERSDSVKKLVLNPATQVTVVLKTGKKMENVKLTGFENSRFSVEVDGKEQKLFISDVRNVEMSMDMQRTPDAAGAAQGAGKGEEVDIAALLKTGQVTVIHFHSKDSVASTRTGSYAQSLAKSSKGKISVAQIDVPDWDSPVAKQHDIHSVPQFWFYSRQGKLVRKLTERFTTIDIDDALKEAQR